MVAWRQIVHSIDETITSTLPRNSYARWAWEGWGQTSAMFLQSPPDELGHLGDNEFPVAFATYLGQACPAVAPLVGRYFGKKGTVLDEFGANLAAASLPGQGHRRLHNLLQGLLQSMMELGGVYSTKEAVNFLLGHVPDPFISRYIRHVSQCPNARNAPFGMIPDLHAQNYPTGRQRVNDSGSHLSAEAIFEVKTFVACNSRYGNNNSQISPANRRAKQVCQTYVLKTKKLDNKFAPEIVGDGTGNVVGPFQTMLGRFYRGQVLPVCAGWFGEINIDFDKILRQLARKAAAGDHGLRISPLINNDRKGGAFPIMLHQFRRAIGVAIVRGNAQHKLGRLHYVRATPEEAADACRANHSSNRWNSQRHGQSNWFSQHTPDGYGTYEQFRNGYDHCVP